MKRTITVHLTDTEYLKFKDLAEADGITLAEWARRKLRAPATYTAPEVMEAAYKALDTGDSGAPPVVPPKAAPVITVESLGTPLPVIDEHSCVHFLMIRRRNGASPATCTNPQQRGRPCHWPSGSASQCSVFHPRR